MSGVPQVCTITKMVNAVWIDALAQPCASWISGTNRVHEYWKFDAATMQPMPTTSCVHRLTCVAGAEPSGGSFSTSGHSATVWRNQSALFENVAALWGLIGRDRDPA